MKIDILNEWTRRLDSGDIPQGHGQLGRGAERCCLGVLCDMAVEAGVVEKRVIEGDVQYRPVGYSGTDEESWEGGVLPRPVAEWAGLDSCNPDVRLETLYTNRDGNLTTAVNLSSANDGTLDGNGNELLRRHSFTEIADLIRKNL